MLISIREMREIPSTRAIFVSEVCDFIDEFYWLRNVEISFGDAMILMFGRDVLFTIFGRIVVYKQFSFGM